MEIKQGRRKSFDIEFVDVTSDNMADVANWCGGIVGDEDGTKFISIIDEHARNARQKKAFVGDRVVHHKELDSYKSFSLKSFDNSYEETVEVGLDRSAETGKFVSHDEAEANPSTTVHETVVLPRDAGLS